MTEKDTKLEICEVCSTNKAKYTCPKCEVRTCTLQCVNIHKKELNCDGIRNRTKYIPINKFTNIDLLSDYRLLEDTTRKVDSLKKSKFRYFSRMQQLPKFLCALKMGLKNRNTTIEFLPNLFDRHKQNKTRLFFKTDTVFWTIEWIFSQADNLKVTLNSCDENLKISTLLSRLLQLDELSDPLKFYKSAGINTFNIFLKAEMKTGQKYYELDSSTTLKDCLKNKIIIEYPTIYVTLKDHRYMFEVIDDSDEEADESGNINAAEYISKMVIKEENMRESTGNLLFNGENMELSDDEI